MQLLRTLARRAPWASHVYHRARDTYRAARRKGQGPEAIFTDIFRNNDWAGAESISGQGSDYTQTRVIMEALPRLFRWYEVRSVLDIPCGDFYWMSRVDLSGVDYMGGDIVKDLVERNRTHERPNVRFKQLDLIAGELPPVDLIFCRDCLVHFSDADAQRALENICRSSATYLLTTSFPGRDENPAIRTGEWRPVNLRREPFCLPEPLELINEGCTENGGDFPDKSLGLWRISELRSHVATRGSASVALPD